MGRWVSNYLPLCGLNPAKKERVNSGYPYSGTLQAVCVHWLVKFISLKIKVGLVVLMN